MWKVPLDKVGKQVMLGDVRGQRGSLRPATLPGPLSPGHAHLIVPVTVRPIPRLCRPVGEPGAEHGPTCQGCAGGDPRAATVLYAHQGHPASPPTPCHHQPNASSRASRNSPRNQRPAVCLPAHPLLLLKIRGTWNLGPHWEGNLEDQYWLVEPSAPSPTEGPGTVTTSLPSCQ